MQTAPTLTALQVMQDAPVIPVIVLNDVAHAVPMVRAPVAGGIRMLPKPPPKRVHALR